MHTAQIIIAICRRKAVEMGAADRHENQGMWLILDKLEDSGVVSHELSFLSKNASAGVEQPIVGGGVVGTFGQRGSLQCRIKLLM